MTNKIFADKFLLLPVDLDDNEMQEQIWKFNSNRI